MLYAHAGRMIATTFTRPGFQGNIVANPELGTKRFCAGCSLKFYDLNRTPIVCPTCETVFVVPKPAPARPRRVFDRQIAPAPQMATAQTADVSAENKEDAEVGVPMLEEMDEE